MENGHVNPAASNDRAARWAAHRARRRTELVGAAIQAIREHGAGVSVATVAAQAGVTKPVLYRHFTDRADLEHAVSERAAQLLVARIVPELAAERPPAERLRSIVSTLLIAAEEEPELWRFVVHNPGRSQGGGKKGGRGERGERMGAEREGTERGEKEGATGRAGQGDRADDVVAHSIALVAGLLTTALVDELRGRELDAGGAEAWAFGLAGMVFTVVDWWLQRRTMSRTAVTEYLTSLAWGGLRGVLGTRTAPTGTEGGAREAGDRPAASDLPLRLVTDRSDA